MKVFVTGGAGFIGSVVVRTLIAEGHSVRCLLRKTTKTERIEGLAYERIEGDIRDAASLKAGMDGCDGVIHLASLSAWNDIDSPLMDEVVEKGTRNILDLALAMPVKPRVVFASSILAINGSDEPKVYDEASPFTLPIGKLNYSRCKISAEKMCLDAVKKGLQVSIVNPAEVYGPNDRELITACNLIDFAKSSPVLVCKGGTSVVYVDDVALGTVRALEKGRAGERYILGGDNLNVTELAGLCLEILGQKKSIMRIPNPIIKVVAKIGLLFHIPLPFNAHVIPYATKFWFMDSGKAQRELGITFRSARACLEPTIKWLQETGRVAVTPALTSGVSGTSEKGARA